MIRGFRLSGCAELFEISKISASQIPVDKLLVFGVDDVSYLFQRFDELPVTPICRQFEHLREQLLAFYHIPRLAGLPYPIHKPGGKSASVGSRLLGRQPSPPPHHPPSPCSPGTYSFGFMLPQSRCSLLLGGLFSGLETFSKREKHFQLRPTSANKVLPLLNHLSVP